MMAHSLTSAPATTATAAAAAEILNKKTTQFPCLTFQKVAASTNASVSDDKLSRRSLMNVSLGMAGLVLGSDFRGGNANAAAKRPPPPPPQEKKDPNLSGTQAKVLASKKRKEALKESVAKLREKGKAIQEPSK